MSADSTTTRTITKPTPAPVAPGTRITIVKPDDFHHHFRDGSVIATVAEHASRRFARCLVMPNLKPPITTTEMALDYRQRILNTPIDNEIPLMQPLMTL
jgi:dihydroorotase